MAKQIKIIKCPNCGSIQKTEIKPDHYRCENCHTEYFLDSDDINVNVTYDNRPTNLDNTFLGEFKLKIIVILGCIVIGYVCVFLINMFFKSKPSYDAPAATTQIQQNQTTTTKSVSANPQIAQSSGTLRVNYNFCSLVLVDNKPFVMGIINRSNGLPYEQNYYFTVYDLLSEKIVQESPIANVKFDKFGKVNWTSYDFTKDKTYLVASKRTVFLLDKKNFTLTDVTSSLLQNYPQFNKGIASVNITTAQGAVGQVLHILTDDGQKIYYFPLQDKAFVDNNDFYMTIKDFERSADDTSKHTAFSFANNYGEDFKLIKFTFISPDGKSHYTFTSAKVGDQNTDGSGKFTDAANAYNYSLPYYYNPKYQLVSHQNLTPDRLYFNPEIIYFDDNTLIIKTRTSASPDSNYNYQRLDINNGKVIWTLSSDDITIKEIMLFNDGFIIKQSCDKYAQIASDGTIIKKLTLVNEK